jgi:hypothetical protein
MAKKVFVDPTLPKVSIEVDGVTYYLCFSFNAICQAEASTGLNLLNALDFRSVDATKLRALLFSALLRIQPDTTLESAGSLLNLKTAGMITRALTEAFTESHPEPNKDVDQSPNAPKPE